MNATELKERVIETHVQDPSWCAANVARFLSRELRENIPPWKAQGILREWRADAYREAVLEAAACLTEAVSAKGDSLPPSVASRARRYLAEAAEMASRRVRPNWGLLPALQSIIVRWTDIPPGWEKRFLAINPLPEPLRFVRADGLLIRKAPDASHTPGTG